MRTSISSLLVSKPPSQRSVFFRYGVAVSGVTAATLVALWAEPFSYTTPFLFYFPVAVLAAWFGGFRAGLLSAVLASAAANYFLLSPYHDFSSDVPSLLRTLFFAVTFTIICWFAELAQKQLGSVIAVQSKLLDMSFEPVLIRDIDDRIVYWNEGAERFYGWSRAEALGQVSHTLLNTIFPKPINEVLEEFRSERHWHGNLIQTKKDGSKVVVVSSWTLQDRDSRSAILETNHDITELRRTEERLRYVSAIVQSSSDAIIGKTLTGIITSWNHGAEILYGYTSSEAVGQPISILIPSGSENELPQILQRLAKGERIEDYETLRRCKDGTLVPISVRISPIVSANGAIVGASSIARDITERKRAEAALREGEQQLRTVLNALPVGVVLCDATGRLTQANAAAAAIWGGEFPLVKIEEYGRFKGRRPGKTALLEPTEWALVRALLKGETILGEEIEIEAFDGTRKTILNNALPIRNSDGTIMGAVAVNVDITDRKQTELALIKTEKLASVGRMAATIAHEVNNPLAAAMNAMFLVGTNPQFPESGRKNLQLAERELERVAHMTKQTLGFYKERAGVPNAVQLPEILDEILDLYGPKLKNNSVSVSRRYGTEGVVHAVEGETRQIISNMLANSIDAMPEGGNLHIRTAGPVTLNGRPLIAVTIADTGEGIAAEHIKRLYEPFFTTRQSVGTGLGLWVTKELLKKNDGRIRVRSRVGKGTVFTIWLPHERRGEQRSKIA